MRVYQPDILEKEIMKRRSIKKKKEQNVYKQNEEDITSFIGIDEDILNDILKSSPFLIVSEKFFWNSASCCCFRNGEFS